MIRDCVGWVSGLIRLILGELSRVAQQSLVK